MRAGADNVRVLRPAAQPEIEPFRPFYVSQMEGRQPKPREWLVDGVLLRRTVMLITGAPKIGKSLLLQQMLTAAATGQSWLGRQTVHCRSFGLFCEDAQDELERRQTDINAYYDRTAADLELDFSWESREGKDGLLVEFERYGDTPKWTALWHQLNNFVREDGVQIVGLDTAAVVFGGNENFRGQTTRFLRELQKLAMAIDGAVILNAHPSRSNPNSFSGNTAWLASVRAGLSLGRPPDFDHETGEPKSVRMLRGLGANYGAGVTAERIEYQDGVFVSAEPEERASRPGPLTTSERMELRYRLLIGLRRVLENGAKVPADEFSPGSLPSRVRRSPDRSINKVALNELYAAQHELIETGHIVRVDVGRKCLIRPAEGPYYPNEEPWLPAAPPARK